VASGWIREGELEDEMSMENLKGTIKAVMMDLEGEGTGGKGNIHADGR
jgi:hypothetical protein